MDLNYLLARHQVSVVAARNAASLGARLAHGAFASAYEARIHSMQSDLGATARLATSA